MGQTEEIRMMSRPNRFTYTPITRGHKPTASQESNTLSTMSEVGQFDNFTDGVVCNVIIQIAGELCDNSFNGV